jgi:hypothetical protein
LYEYAYKLVASKPKVTNAYSTSLTDSETINIFVVVRNAEVFTIIMTVRMFVTKVTDKVVINTQIITNVAVEEIPDAGSVSFRGMTVSFIVERVAGGMDTGSGVASFGAFGA